MNSTIENGDSLRRAQIVYELDALLEAMTVETFPEAIDWGPIVGEEIW